MFLNGQRGKKYVDGNYDISINILAVTGLESLLSCFEREVFFIENELPPRAVTIENHDRAYTKMLDTVRAVEKENLYTTMRVFRRGYAEESPELVCVAGDNKFPSIVDAIKYERTHQEMELYNSKSNIFQQRINDLRERLRANPNTSLELRLARLEEIFKNKLKYSNNQRMPG